MPVTNNNGNNLYNVNINTDEKKTSLMTFTNLYDNNMQTNIVGTTKDRFGSVVAISGDGNTIAVGAPYFSTIRDDGSIAMKLCGRVVIYKLVGINWVVKGILTGERDYYMMGISLDLNNNGNKIIIGSSNFKFGISYYISITPTTHVSDLSSFANILTEGSLAAYGAAMEWPPGVGLGFSYLMAAGEDPLAEATPNFKQLETPVELPSEGRFNVDINRPACGNVKVYQYNHDDVNPAWNQIFTMDGENFTIPSNLGTTVSISDDGSIISYGAPRYSIARRYRKIVLDYGAMLVAAASAAFEIATGGLGMIIETLLKTLIDGIVDISQSREWLQKIEYSYRIDSLMYKEACGIYTTNREKRTVDTAAMVGNKLGTSILKASFWAGRGGDITEQYAEFVGSKMFTDYYLCENMGVVEVFKLTVDGYYLPITTFQDPHIINPRLLSHRDNIDINVLPSNFKMPQITGKLFPTRIPGSDDKQFIGSVVSMSKTGNKLVTLCNQEKILTYFYKPDNNKIWVKNEYELYDEGIFDHTETTLSISGNGYILAAGYPFHNTTGCVRFYRWVDLDRRWLSYGSLDGINGKYFSRFGTSVSLSYDGNIVAIGSPFSKYIAEDDKSGDAKSQSEIDAETDIFRKRDIMTICERNMEHAAVDSTSANKALNSYHGYGGGYGGSGGGGGLPNSYYKTHPSYDSVINRLAADCVRVEAIYDDALKKYEKAKMDYNEAVGILQDANIAYRKCAGSVSVYKCYPGSGIWEPMGSTINGDYLHLLGTTVKLSNDGLTLIVGVPGLSLTDTAVNKITGINGFVKVFKFIDGEWNQNFDGSKTNVTPVETVAPKRKFNKINGKPITNMFLNNTNFVDPGLLVADGSYIDEIISDVKIDKIGYYNITYKMVDTTRNNHISLITRDVNVIKSPSFPSAPYILYMDDPFNINNLGLGMPYEKCEIVSTENTVNMKKPGKYVVKHEIKIVENPYDDSKITVTRNIVVLNRNIIKLNGSNIFVKQYSTYTDLLGAYIININKPEIKITNIPITVNIQNVNTSVLGTYKVVYSATDILDVERTVTVVEPHIKSYDQVLSDTFSN